mmetsp:Transcript_41601/g.97170  ORF Transcript_41601/g.97170 Transcript_41601/m.97170 type:complete len:220 (+) Transcript_41601:45-704(+)
MVLIQRFLAHRAWYTPIGASSLCSLCPGLGVWMLVEPRCDAISAEDVGTGCQLWDAPYHVDLADLADELFGFLNQLLLLDLHLVQFELLHLDRPMPVAISFDQCLADDAGLAHDACTLHLLLSFGFCLLVLLFLLILFFLLFVRLLFASRRGIILGVVLGPRRSDLLLVVCQIEVVVERLVVDSIRILARIDITIDAVSNNRQVADFNCIIAYSSQQLL